jgi:hypothetical protein
LGRVPLFFICRQACWALRFTRLRRVYILHFFTLEAQSEHIVHLPPYDIKEEMKESEKYQTG